LSEKLDLVDGPFKGTIIEGLKFHGRYPDRIQFEFDGFAMKDNLCGPDEFFMEGGGTMIATYEFDCGWGYFEFKGWTAKHNRKQNEN
jgi:hypothetical protein